MLEKLDLNDLFLMLIDDQVVMQVGFVFVQVDDVIILSCEEFGFVIVQFGDVVIEEFMCVVEIVKIKIVEVFEFWQKFDDEIEDIVYDWCVWNICIIWIVDEIDDVFDVNMEVFDVLCKFEQNVLQEFECVCGECVVLELVFVEVDVVFFVFFGVYDVDVLIIVVDNFVQVWECVVFVD